jgi:hypothetical protein
LQLVDIVHFKRVFVAVTATVANCNARSFCGFPTLGPLLHTFALCCVAHVFVFSESRTGLLRDMSFCL